MISKTLCEQSSPNKIAKIIISFSDKLRLPAISLEAKTTSLCEAAKKYHVEHARQKDCSPMDGLFHIT
jgi:hypothetical protein